MKCEDYKLMILERDNASDLPEAVTEHIRNCPSCRNTLNAWSEIKDFKMDAAPPETADAVIMSEAGRYINNRLDTKKYLLRWFPFAAAAACVTLLSWLYLHNMHIERNGNQNTITVVSSGNISVPQRDMNISQSTLPTEPDNKLSHTKQNSASLVWKSEDFDNEILQLDIAIELDRTDISSVNNEYSEEQDIQEINTIIDYLDVEDDIMS